MVIDCYQEIFERSRTERKGLTLYVNGLAVNGYVIALHEDHVELRNQGFDRIAVYLNRIDGVASN